MREQELVKTLEEKFITVLNDSITLEQKHSITEVNKLTGNEEQCVCYMFSDKDIKKRPWLKSLLIWVVPSGNEVAFLLKDDQIILSCMSDEHKKWIEEDDVVTVEIESISYDDIKQIVETCIDDYIRTISL